MTLPFLNQTVCMTGASSGFGEQTARLFAKEGARLVLVARRQERLEELQQELRDHYGTESVCVPLDVTDHQAVTERFDQLAFPFAVPDILINNAGLALGKAKIWEISPEEWNLMIDVNLKGVLNVTRYLLPKMLQANQGHVINVGSVSGHDVYPGGGVYCSTKYAVRALTDTLRMELVDTPLRVSLISPGMAKTEFSLVRFEGDQGQSEQVYEGLEPLTAQDVAEAIVFIASRPPHVNIADLIIYPKAQASTTLTHRKKRIDRLDGV